MVNSTSYASPFLLRTAKSFVSRQTVPFFVQTVSGCYFLCLLIYSLMDMTGNPLGNTPCHFISRQSFCPKVYGRPEDSALNSLHSTKQIPTKRWLASCPAELETVYSTFVCVVSTCLPVVSSIFFDDNKSTPSLFFLFFHPRTIDSILVVRNIL